MATRPRSGSKFALLTRRRLRTPRRDLSRKDWRNKRLRWRSRLSASEWPRSRRCGRRRSASRTRSACASARRTWRGSARSSTSKCATRRRDASNCQRRNKEHYKKNKPNKGWKTRTVGIAGIECYLGESLLNFSRGGGRGGGGGEAAT